MKIRILVAVDRNGAAWYVDPRLMTAATQGGYDLDTDSMQYRIVEAEVPVWQEPPVPVVQGEAREVTL